jgi:Tat protein secretion system quality control protein TatD with DNase activity
VEQFTQAEKLGLRIMPAQKILLETDAPHGKLSSVPIRVRRHSIPNEVHLVAKVVVRSQWRSC